MEFEDKDNIIANNYFNNVNHKFDNWNKVYYEFNKILSNTKLGIRVSKRVGTYINHYIYKIIDEKEWILTKIKHGIL